MTRVFTDGAEFGDFLFWDVGVDVIDGATKRSGNYSYQKSGDTWTKNITPLSEFYFRFGFRTNIFAYYIFCWRKSTTALGWVSMNSTTGHFELRVGSTVVATGSHACAANTWYLLEVHVKIADAGGILELKVDGVDDCSYSGDTQPGSDTTVDNLYFHRNGGSAIHWSDDLALNDTSGSVDNSWCGDGHVILLQPNAAGDVTQLTPTSGSDNWSMVDDIPADGDTTYVESSGSGAYDLYNVQDSGLSNVAILRMWPEARARDLVAEGSQMKFVVKTDGVEYEDTAHDLLTSYSRIVGDVYRKNPGTDSDWTISDIESIQIGPKVA